MKRILPIIIILIVTGFTLQGQNRTLSAKDTSWFPKGFDFMVGGGAYFANSHTANYYNGASYNENNLNYIFDNQYRYDEIQQVIINKYPQIGIEDTLSIGELPLDMKYKAAMSFSLGFRYKFNKNWGINLNYAYARVKTTDIFTIDYTHPAGNIYPTLIEYLVGQEDRSVIDLSVSYLFHPHEVFKPFIELGAQFNYVNVRKFLALIEDKEFQLLDYYGGENYVPGEQLQEYETKYGGAGYGFSFAAGVKLVFNKYVSIDPTFYLSASSIGLKGYKEIRFQYGAYIRLVVSDLIFSKKQ